MFTAQFVAAQRDITLPNYQVAKYLIVQMCILLGWYVWQYTLEHRLDLPVWYVISQVMLETYSGQHAFDNKRADPKLVCCQLIHSFYRLTLSCRWIPYRMT